ncbi:MAG: 1-acyl-sn-glycerol-3-phosphate acyltransferase [Sphingobacteriia bacterium]|nr:1-acyl-sn-glycerol-3-phosphate acyltransferase [Sphingobacteriia bacterium]NCC38694.1 1-acyl-sn-glycerol-3-phosphate acyltransferase [Gammaproteobacteria bacterium]
MVLLRSLVYLLVLVLSVIVFAILIMIFGLFASDHQLGRLGQAWGRFNLAALGLICGLKYRVTGLDTLPREGAIVLCKHQSAWETIALRGLLPPNQSWVLKRELMRIPLFGGALARFRSIPIDRSAGRRAMIQMVRDGQQHLEEGRWIVIFPEGTRVAPGDRKPYGIGGAVLAERTGRPVVPVAHNAGHFWGRRTIRKLPGTIDLVIGPVISTQGRKAAEINAEVEDWIESMVGALPGPSTPAKPLREAPE